MTPLRLPLVRTTLLARPFSTTLIRPVTDPKIHAEETTSGSAVKADKHEKSPEALQREQTHATNSERGERENPTLSEDAVHGSKHNKGPEQLQKETAGKA